MVLDYLTLKLIWWLFASLLLIGFALSAGIDIGAAALLIFVGRSDKERRAVLKFVAPMWWRSQVWFIIAGGAVFAAWPLVYAAASSGFREVLLLAVFALFLRPVGFDCRSKIANSRNRLFWDCALAVDGALSASFFGLALGNMLQGIPFLYDGNLRASHMGDLFALWNPFGLFAGMLSLAMLAMHGGAGLQRHTEGEILARARSATRLAALGTIALFAVAGIWVATSLPGYRIAQMPDAGQVFSPLAKTVVRAAGAWMDNYAHHPWMWGAPAAGVLGAALTLVLRERDALLGSSVSVAGIILTVGLSMFPFVMPSSFDWRSSLTAWDAVSSRQTLNFMFWGMALMLPLGLGFTAWVNAGFEDRL